MTATAPAPIGSSPPHAADTADRTDWLSSIPFFGAHLVPLAAFFVVVTWEDWLLCGLLYVIRMFFITAGYHRYLSHRSFRTGRFVQFVLAAGGTTALQKGPLWWAGHHRLHHRFTDLDQDVHSPRDGFWWSHVGWILSTRYKRTELADIKDFAAFPELRLLERAWWLGPLALAAGCYLIGGWGGLVIGFFLSTVLLWHATFLVNSAAHLIGRRRFATPDTSRNSAVIAFITGGEGWHNNHHYLPASARQGFTRWEFDPTWYVLRALAALRLVRDLRDPPAQLLGQARVRDGAFDIGMFRSYWERAARVTGERIADLSTRPLAASAEAHGEVEEGPATGDDPSVGTEPLSRLSGLITRALESADKLAASTRRTRKGTRVAQGEAGSTDTAGP
jgi:stearoyl-CoA desaturase (delta-9 desaturase)